MTQTDFWILGAICGVILTYYLLKYWRSYIIKLKISKAQKGEKKAKDFLEKHGYEVIDIQPRIPILTQVNGRSYKNHVKVDFIVKRDGKRYVVEVKTGKQVERPVSADIRRQLLEYYLMYRTDGALVLDMTNEKIYDVEFNIKRLMDYNYNYKTYLAVLVSFFCGFILALLLFKGGIVV